MWEPDLLERRISAEPGARGFLLVLPCPAGPLPAHAAQLAGVGVAALVTLVPSAEAAALGLDLPALERACADRGIRWAHAPLVDFGVPDAAFERVWERLGAELGALLGEARGVALHCRAGLGRSGTIAARLLIELVLDPAEALARVRAARPGAIETAAQEHHLRMPVRRGGG
ncbi:MAG: hypothetical protein K6T74_15115 [Geminicoccaceae bacterium]|nr:hypothetical protein [Geminicoccaceae bacterium]